MTVTAPPGGLGLTHVEAAARLARDGPNTLPPPRRPHPLALLAAQMGHFFALMLWVAAALAFVAGMPALGVAIGVVVVVNGAFSFAQEYRADRATERLRDLMPVHATVRRDGMPVVVPAAELVVGDVVLLDAGDRVCADLELVPDGRVRVDESMLTGESAPVSAAAGDRVHAGTFVVEGQATARVVATGGRTRLAAIAAVTAGARRPPSPLAAQLHRVVRMVALMALAVGLVFFLVALALGQASRDSFLFAIGVTVALVPEGLLPTVTLSLARGAQRMAHRKALVRHLEAVETLGSTTFICTDKTGTLTRGQMAAVEVWTPAGQVRVEGEGYRPEGRLVGATRAVEAARQVGDSAARCSPDAHAAQAGGQWRPVGDPMDVALHVLATRAGAPVHPAPLQRHPFDPRRRRSSVVDAEGVHVLGSPDVVLLRCLDATPDAETAVETLSARGLRVLAVAHRPPGRPDATADLAERDLHLLGLVGLEDPPRPDVGEAIARCRRAGIRLAMVTGDHPRTAAAIATEVGLATPGAPVLRGADLPQDDAALAELIDHDGLVLARVTPEDKLRIAQALQSRGHVVAMTGDGVNDGPALRAADIGVAMGASGTDVAREAADVVLLDDHFATIVGAVELGRATFTNIRRFLTYHLTDNVAELTPFVVWALSGGRIPLALTVLQVLALDIGTDQLPALALGAEPPGPRAMVGRMRLGSLIDGPVARRALLVLGPTEALVSMVAFLVVLGTAGWAPGTPVSPWLLGVASGTAFATVVLGQVANAFACRSEGRWVGLVGVRGNRLLLYAVASEIAMLLVFVGAPPLQDLLGGHWPGAFGWLLAALAIPAVLLADATHKAWRARHKRPPARAVPLAPPVTSSRKAAR
ncbi:cation-transporting P-type ATPase [Oryzihumus sp.]|uniref:cation-translocating P-type ATPase n=1 Tax=Oryzihumus sp. TaxID=1968903 RepID=UPI002ED8D10A